MKISNYLYPNKTPYTLIVEADQNAVLLIFDILVPNDPFLKYFSYIDNLDLTIEDITNFSPYKYKEVIESLNKKPPEILNGLEDPSLRSYHITIETNLWLKHLLLKDFDALKNSRIHLNLEQITYVYGFKLFLETYLKPIIPDVIHFMLDNNEHKLLFNTLSKTDLFSSEIHKKIIRCLEDRINFAINYLKKIPVFEPDKNIKYAKSYHFYETINLYEHVFKDDLIELYDTIIEIHEQFDENSLDPIFSFTSQCQVAFQKSQIDDVAVKLFVDNNADNAKEYAYRNPSVTKKDSTKFPLKNYGIISLLTIVLFVVLLIGATYNNLTTQSNNQTEKNNYNSTKKKRTTYDNRIRFYYSLKRVTKKGKVNTTLNETKLIPFSNPYPKTFNLVTNDTTPFQVANTWIANKTNSDLIIFKMINGTDESIYIPKNEDVHIVLKASDSLLFYSGNNFVQSKFSHFREDMAISEIYEVTKINDATSSVITIMPITPEIDSQNNTISKEHIEVSDNVELKKISINTLYRAYYDQYMN